MQALLFVIAISVDVFLACMACGAEKIKIERKTALCISLVCSGVLFLALVAGKLFGGMLKERYLNILCFLGLFLIGVWKLSEYAVRRYIRKHKFLCKRVKITFSQLNLILSIYNNPVMADKDHSKVMSVRESVSFALAMSVDGMFGGISAGFLGVNIILTTLCNFLLGIVAVSVGSMLGRRFALRRESDFSWVSGALFLILAFGKILEKIL